MRCELRDPSHPDHDRVAAALAAIERDVDYPLGTDRFRIDHGADYFAFFRRLGPVRYAVATTDTAPAAVLVGALRTLHVGDEPRRAWYLGDLKAAADARAPGVARALVRAFVTGAEPAARAGFGVSMDPPTGRNPLVRLARSALPGVRVGARLGLWSLDTAAFARVRPVLEQHRGPLTLRSLRGIKDIVLRSTGRPMPLWHVEHRAPGRPSDAPPPGPGPDDSAAIHMFCAPLDGALATDLATAAHPPGATATVLQQGLDGLDWDFLTTSEI